MMNMAITIMFMGGGGLCRAARSCDLSGSTMLSPGGYNLFLNEGYSAKYTADPHYGFAIMFCCTHNYSTAARSARSARSAAPAGCSWQAIVDADGTNVVAASIKSPPVANSGGVKSNDGVIYASFGGMPEGGAQVRHLVLVAHSTAADIKQAILSGGGFECTQHFPFNNGTCTK
jgi:hypothetical protein